MSVLPKIGAVLRDVVTISGYRPLIEDLGLGKDLDDLAVENRASSNCELLYKIEAALEHEIRKQCGDVWANTLCRHWSSFKFKLRQESRERPEWFFDEEVGESTYSLSIGGVVLSILLEDTLDNTYSPNQGAWWKSPFGAWVSMVSNTCGITESRLVDNIANYFDASSRTADERWSPHGEAIGLIKWPMKPVVEAALIGGVLDDTDLIEQLTGWLQLAVAFQSCPVSFRRAVETYFLDTKKGPVAPPFKNIGIVRKVLDQTHQIEKNLGDGNDVHRLKKEIDDQREFLFCSAPNAMFFYHKNSANFAVLREDKEAATRHFKQAVESVWWKGADAQEFILKEALLYAIGVGDKNSANLYWDRIFMLGLIQGEKPPLDDQNIRQLTFSFQHVYPERLSKQKVPPPIEFELLEAFELDNSKLKHPNKKEKFLEGQTVRTPLMEAIRKGSLADVKRLIENDPARVESKNGDPDFSVGGKIFGSSSGPLIQAMWRARNRKESDIMNYLLYFDLKPETVNREVGTDRETPLSVAVEMGDVKTIKRLVELGADVHASCRGTESALCAALELLAGEQRGVTVHEAKMGLLFDRELQEYRDKPDHLLSGKELMLRDLQFKLKSTYASSNLLVDVIKALLAHGADPNQKFNLWRRYSTVWSPTFGWTPTLLAAKIGDLPLFKLLVENSLIPGDPTVLLEPEGRDSSRKDALWIAKSNNHVAIVQYLQRH